MGNITALFLSKILRGELILLETLREGTHRVRLTGAVRGCLAHSAPGLRDDSGLENILPSEQVELLRVCGRNSKPSQCLSQGKGGGDERKKVKGGFGNQGKRVLDVDLSPLP